MVVQIVIEVLIILVGSCGLLLHSGWLSGTPRKDFFRYYTNVSNVLVVLFYLTRMVVRITGNYDGFFGRIVFSELCFYSVTMSIVLTFGIYNFVLAPSFKNAPPESNEFKFSHSFSNYCVHYIVPLLSLLNWFIFSDKAAIQYKWCVIWIVIPLIYGIYSIIRGLRGDIIENTSSAYPYDFMDIGKYGWKTFIRNILFIMVVFVVVGFVMLFVRKLL